MDTMAATATAVGAHTIAAHRRQGRGLPRDAWEGRGAGRLARGAGRSVAGQGRAPGTVVDRGLFRHHIALPSRIVVRATVQPHQAHAPGTAHGVLQGEWRLAWHALPDA